MLEGACIISNVTYNQRGRVIANCEYSFKEMMALYELCKRYIFSPRYKRGLNKQVAGYKAQSIKLKASIKKINSSTQAACPVYKVRCFYSKCLRGSLFHHQLFLFHYIQE